MAGVWGAPFAAGPLDRAPSTVGREAEPQERLAASPPGAPPAGAQPALRCSGSTASPRPSQGPANGQPGGRHPPAQLLHDQSLHYQNLLTMMV